MSKEYNQISLSDVFEGATTRLEEQITDLKNYSEGKIWFITVGDIKSPIPNLMSDVDGSTIGSLMKMGYPDVVLINNVNDENVLHFLEFVAPEVSLAFLIDDDSKVEPLHRLTLFFNSRMEVNKEGMVAYVKEFVESEDIVPRGLDLDVTDTTVPDMSASTEEIIEAEEINEEYVN